ncbi:MAG: pyrroline-5-carboxylate reductase [Gemmatimonadetes bacterium]|nr:pyrroline-5-carboxylate reductase [Gemmatimonadota bacterium]
MMGPGVPQGSAGQGPATGGVASAVKIRPAASDDLQRIAELLTEYARMGWLRRRSLGEIHRDLGGFIVAIGQDDTVVGCVALRVHSPALTEIASLAVDESQHGQGIGRRLVEAALLRAHTRGARRVFAFTHREKLFLQLGFQTAPVTEFPQKLASDYGGFALAAGPKAAVVLDLEGPVTAPAPDRPSTRRTTEQPASHSNQDDRSTMSYSQTDNRPDIAILGGGNLGRALAMGWTEAGYCAPSRISITRRQPEKLGYFADAGFRVGSDNAAAVQASDVVVLAVQPQQIGELLEEIAHALEVGRHRVISVVSGVSIRQLRERLGQEVTIVRAMPNTAVSIRESMTCLSGEESAAAALAEAQELFEFVGRTLVVPENMMIPATALCACGVAFFLRSIRAASQGGIEIGFHPEEALLLAAQTAKGAAALVLSQGRHPESEIDQVTTPRGCTIAGLNEMEHQGFSSAMIKGILLSARKAGELYQE